MNDDEAVESTVQDGIDTLTLDQRLAPDGTLREHVADLSRRAAVTRLLGKQPLAFNWDRVRRQT